MKSTFIIFTISTLAAIASPVKVDNGGLSLSVDHGVITRLSVGNAVLEASPGRCGFFGLGVIPRGRERQFADAHRQFSFPLLDHVPENRAREFYRLPSDKSMTKVVNLPERAVEITWSGLEGSDGFHANDLLRFTIHPTADGFIAVEAYGESPDENVFGVRLGLPGIPAAANLVLPVMCGLRFPLAGLPDGQATFAAEGLCYEAPLAIVEHGGNTFAMWSEDAKFNPHGGYFARRGEHGAVGLTFHALMPFNDKRNIRTPELKFGVFPDKGWPAAARPYRDWYAKTFDRELAIRDSAEPRDIRVYMKAPVTRPSESQIDDLAKSYGRHLLWYVGKLSEETTLTGRFDWELPRHTPDRAYVERAKSVQARGIRTACYALGYCVNYQSELFEKDGIAKMTKPVRHRLYSYGAPPKTWESYKKDDLVYVDMNSARWRNYVARIHEKFLKETGVDTFYEDCLGCINDPGNGLLQDDDGTWGAQGASQFARLVLEKFQRAFMTEYGAAPVAFAAKWPLVMVLNRNHRNHEFLKFRRYRQLPLTAFLFGYRPWSGWNEWKLTGELATAVTAIADSTGGLGIAVLPPYDFPGPWFDVMEKRARLFNDKALVPCFPEEGVYPAGVVCQYRGVDGVYSFRCDGDRQTMLAPDGAVLYEIPVVAPDPHEFSIH